MKTNPVSQSGMFRLRLLLATALCFIGASFGWLSFASTPSSGTLTENSGPVTYTAGPFFAPNAFGNSIAGECDPDPSFPLVPCDIFRLTVTLPADYSQTHPNQSVFVRVEWGTPAADFDLYFWDAASWPTDSFPQGAPITQSRQAATNFEQVEVPAVGGTHHYVVQVSTTLPAGQSFTGRIFIAPASPAAVPVVPPGNASGIAPRFQDYIPTDASGAPSSSLGLFAGEPTIFANPKTDSVFYQGLLEVLRLKFDDGTSPAKVTWEPKDNPMNISNKVTLDPILLGDPLPHGNPPSHRVWAMQLTGGQSATDYSDDDGETWTPALSGGLASGPDHQGMGVGPYPANLVPPIVPPPTYPQAVYYCSQAVGAAFCARSVDGGLTYGPNVPIYNSISNRCVGLHGHPKVAPDGTVYVPDKGCGLDIPVIGEGLVSVAVSEDAGITWQVRQVPDSSGGLTSKGDPGLAIDSNNKVYMAYQDLHTNHMFVATSIDRGVTWAPSVDVGALAGINYSVFPSMVAGDSGRAAVAFFGTTYNGLNTNYQAIDFPGVWYLYVATTYDGGNTWFVANGTPNSPIQGAFGGISNGGDGRNHYDFIDATIDREGRVIAANSIGCSASCPHNGGPNTFAKLAGIVRQSGGRRMYAQFDPQEPTFPAAPFVQGYRTSQFISFSWPEPDGGGLPVTGYSVLRSVNGGRPVKLANTTQRHILETADPTKSYTYQVRAINSQGGGPLSNVFSPTVGENAPHPELSCTIPGQLYVDRTSEGGTFPNNDIASFGIAEPSDMPGKLVFVINNAHPEAVQGGNSDFYIFFDPPHGGLSYKLSLTDMEVTFYKNGQFVSDCGAPPISQCRDWQHAADLDPASGIQPDGSVWLVIDKAQLDIQKGDVLLGVSVREDTTGNPSGVFATDYAGGRQDYLVVGNDFCVGPPIPARIVSRKNHGAAGDLDVDLKPPAAGIECRSGGATKDHTLVITFEFPVSVAGNGTVKAQVTSGTGQVGSGGTANGNAITVNGYQVTVPLTNVANAQKLTVSLFGVSDGIKTGDVSVDMRVLLADVNQQDGVNSGDVFLVQQQNGQSLPPNGSADFRRDINHNGSIDSGDVFLAQKQNPSALPQEAGSTNARGKRVSRK